MTDEQWLKGTARPFPRPQIDASTPNIARVWNYLTGGRDNFDADRKAARQMIRLSPAMAHLGYAARAFVGRATQHLAADVGIRQFIDIGVGIPAPGCVHDVAQSVSPTSRVVCVDNDPVVLSHARALLRPALEGATGYVDASIQEPDRIIRAARATLDFAQPTAVVLNHVLHYVGRDAEVRSILSATLDALCPGSYLVMVHAASDLDQSLVEAARRWNKTVPTPQVVPRGRPEIAAWAESLDVLDPGVVPVTDWRPAPADDKYDIVIPLYAAVCRKPS